MSDVVFYSSGSTGGAKQIVRTEESLAADAASLVKMFPEVWGTRPVVVSTVRPEHMYGALWRVRAPQIASSQVDSAVVMSVEELSGLCARYGKILFVTTPSFLEKALGHPDFGNLKGAFVSIVTSGSLLRSETSARVLETTGTSPLEIYGSTETGTVAWRRQANGPHWTLADGVSASLSPSGSLTVASPFSMANPFEMSDAVEFVSERTFLLGGRLDRRVKILEKYVLLSGVEEAFSAHAYVERVRVEVRAGPVARLGALVVLTQEGAEALASSTCTEIAARLRRDLMPVVGKAAFPRRMRFVRRLPVNEQGKTTQAAALDMLESWCSEPAVVRWTETADSFSAALVFMRDLKCFNGHFPSFPVLPGVAQLYFVRHFARQVFPDFPGAVTLKRLKFQRVILPGCPVELCVRRTGDQSWEFVIKSGDGTCSSGVWQKRI